MLQARALARVCVCLRFCVCVGVCDSGVAILCSGAAVHFQRCLPCVDVRLRMYVCVCLCVSGCVWPLVLHYSGLEKVTRFVSEDE